MAQFSIEINDDMLETVFDSFAREFNYEMNKLEGETKQDFTRRRVIEWIKQITIVQSGLIAAAAARAAAESQTNQNLVIE